MGCAGNKIIFMKNWKTNLGALLGLTSTLLSILHVITPDQCVQIQGALIMYLGVVSKDYNSTGK